MTSMYSVTLDSIFTYLVHEFHREMQVQKFEIHNHVHQKTWDQAVQK